MFYFLLLYFAKSFCERWIDQSQGKYEFYTGNGCSNNNGFYTGYTFDNIYKHFVFSGTLTYIPNDWLRSANELRTIESSSIYCIDERAFQNAPKLETVLITTESGSGYINTNAFYNLQNLQRVTIGGAINSLYRQCFANCTNLIYISFLTSSNSLKFDQTVFENCNALKTLIIGRNLELSKLPNLNSLERITFLDSTNSFLIDKNYFSNSLKLTTLEIGMQITINEFPGWVKLKSVNFFDSSNSFTFNSKYFSECIELTTLTIGRPIVASDFPGWINLESVTYTISSNSVSIDSFLFSNCNQLVTLYIGRPISSKNFPGWTQVTKIVVIGNNFAVPFSVFSECTAFLNIEFDPKVSQISANAFKSWISIKSVNIPPTITALGKDCFSGCSRLMSVTFLDTTNPIKIELNAFANCGILETLITGRPIVASSNFPNWTNLNKIIITSDNFVLPISAFTGCESIREIEFQSSVTIIKETPVTHWPKTKSITFSDSTNNLTIDALAFEVCKELTTVKIGRPVISNGFPGWKNLKKVNVISNNFGSSSSLFEGCEFFPNLVFEDSVTALDSNSFSSWNLFKSFTIPASITVLRNGCFSNCLNLESVTFADSSNPITIESGAFDNCDKLTSIIIGRPIESTEFPGWANINKIIITNEIFISPHENFDECNSDLSVEFLSSVYSTSPNLFNSWKNIKTITIPSSIKSISMNVKN